MTNEEIYLYKKAQNGGGGNANVVHLTQAEYDALPDSKLTDDKVYMLEDVNGDGSQFQPVIYSEDEREIGVWTDGKPLYQKTILFMTNNNSGWTDVPHEINNIDEIINIQGMIDGYTSGTNAQGGVAFFGNDTNVSAFTNTSSLYNKLVKLTIRYTKTTDAAGSGTWVPQRVPAVHYSTDEKVVGTWVDGNTLYEKTLVYDVSSTISSNTVLGTITSAEKMFLVSAVAYNSDDNRGLILPFTSGSAKNSISFNNGVVTLILENDSYSSVWTFYITIQYTKTPQGGN